MVFLPNSTRLLRMSHLYGLRTFAYLCWSSAKFKLKQCRVNYKPLVHYGYCNTPDNKAGEDLPQRDISTNEPLVITKNHVDNIMEIAINRSSKRNCVNKDTAAELLNAFYEFEANKDMYCAVFYGIGSDFCAGYDLKEVAEFEEGPAGKLFSNLPSGAGPMGPTMKCFKKPVVAAISGWCVAGGLELALIADLRVAEDGSKFGVLNRRFGVPLIDGGTVRLPKLIGLSRALDLILTGRILEANEAHEMGLVNRVVEKGNAYQHAMDLARLITLHPQGSLRADRKSVYHSVFSSANMDEALAYERDGGMHVTSEALCGAKKFAGGHGRHGQPNITIKGNCEKD